MQKQIPAWAALCIIALVAGLLLGLTNELTAGRIEQQAIAAANEARMSVLPDADSFEQLEIGDDAKVDSVYVGMKNGEAAGYAVQTTVKGYGGEIEITIGMGSDGTITGINVGGPNFAETAGLGSKAKEAAFTDQFKGVTPPAEAGSNIDGISGATITTGAVVAGVNRACTFIQSEVLGEGEEEAEEVPADATVYEGTARGFGGEILAKVHLGADNTIVKVEFEAAGETVGIGTAVEDSAAFKDQFIGKSDTAGVDTISGATISSQAAIDAVESALSLAR